MSIGKRAVVIGAGMGGLAAAGALVRHFDEVVVLERDSLPDRPDHRAGAPQGRHVHALLTAGQRALEQLLPGFTDGIVAAGAVKVRANSDVRVEMPRYDPFPARDHGWFTYAASRPLLEFVTRQLAEAAGVKFMARCRVRGLETGADGASITAVQFEREGGEGKRLECDLVVDASGRAAPTLALLERLSRPAPEQTTIGVDFAYTTQVFEPPADAPRDWKIVMTMPEPGGVPRGGLLAPLEGGLWICSIGSVGEGLPPAELAAFMASAESLRTPTIHQALKLSKPIGEVVCYGFRESIRRHFDRLAPLPRGLVPLGDTICRFNPVYGQGMTVAALEAVDLKRLLDARADGAQPLEGLNTAFLTNIEATIDAAWQMSAIPDLASPTARGERPANLPFILQFGLALVELAARDPEVHRLDAEVRQLMKPPSALTDPALIQRVMTVMAEQQAAATA
ncbi:MAG TPA: FAD-dependent monooxygenase [Caulobacteraceae bacterium]|jgi:2-polyprenyl-6-methoxyphenol hydroxylase-like FAD-dependent oxidoreductase|nr:FAD-dependent monooxygenase [Caulobacteraceae bacterium]